MILFMDIDGTLANAKLRFAKAGPEPKVKGKKYTEWLNKVQNERTLLEDMPIEGMKELAHAIHTGGSSSLVYLTGRSEIYREVTNKWLVMHKFPDADLLMRPKNSRFPNGLLKEYLIKKYLGNTIIFAAVVVVDDDYNGDIEEMCKRNSFTFLKAKSGGYW